MHIPASVINQHENTPTLPSFLVEEGGCPTPWCSRVLCASSKLPAPQFVSPGVCRSLPPLTEAKRPLAVLSPPTDRGTRPKPNP